MKKSKWELVEDINFVQVYHRNGGEKYRDIRVVYPKAPSWAQEVALWIWQDQATNGPPTKKGVKDCVMGQWARMISEAAKKGI
jgi:hypothetical protein